jgi:2-oxoglutarate ferredoxin oxidoreductase subunit beta
VTNPDLTVIVFTGDGDLAAIGLNHFLQAIRRNIDITVICVNNETYGMTGGQVSPTTSMGETTKTTPYKNIEHSFNLSFLAKAAGAVYVSRWTTAHSRQVINSLKKGIQKKGLAFIELMSPCPTSNRRFDEPTDYLNYYLNETINYTKASKDEYSGHVFEELDECFTTRYQGKLIIGEITDLEKPDYHTLYRKLKERARNEFWEQREKRD